MMNFCIFSHLSIFTSSSTERGEAWLPNTIQASVLVREEGFAKLEQWEKWDRNTHCILCKDRCVWDSICEDTLETVEDCATSHRAYLHETWSVQPVTLTASLELPAALSLCSLDAQTCCHQHVLLGRTCLLPGCTCLEAQPSDWRAWILQGSKMSVISGNLPCFCLILSSSVDKVLFDIITMEGILIERSFSCHLTTILKKKDKLWHCQKTSMCTLQLFKGQN